jgi:hypothetical protein
LKGGWLGQGPDKKKIHFCRTNQFGNSLQMVITITKYSLTLPLLKDIIFGGWGGIRIP